MVIIGIVFFFILVLTVYSLYSAHDAYKSAGQRTEESFRSDILEEDRSFPVNTDSERLKLIADEKLLFIQEEEDHLDTPAFEA